MINWLLDKVHKFELTPNEIYVMWCIYRSFPIKQVNLQTELRKLKNAGYLTEDLKIGSKGTLLIKVLELEIKVPDKPKENKSFVPTDENIQEYLSLFPKGKLPSNKLARAHPKIIKDCFIWFFKNFDYSWDLVLKATKYYINEFAAKDYLYMQTSQYFICKSLNGSRTKNSELANYCEALKKTPDLQSLSNPDSFFKDNVV